MRALLAISLFLVGAADLNGQSSSRFNPVLPGWADSALARAGFWAAYDLSSRINPVVVFGDLDGDGLWDVVAEIVDKDARRRGLVIVNQLDRSVHVVGAGRELAKGRDRLPADATWDLGQLLGHRTGVRVNAWHANGWIVWNGQTYAWAPDSE